MTDTSCREILHSLSRFIVKNNVTKPLNDGIICYYSVNNDSLSSAKAMKEKELFITKNFFSSRDT